MTAPSLAQHKLLDIANMVSVVKNLNNALFMACADLDNMEQINALHSVIDEINNRIEVLGERIDEVREELA
ncbi:hypothetical protein [Agrobacterium tumefaciens]|uniref:Uncharacterized protein n=1 Tax=Agrobacterium tumefaciens TaxID=358 RepID=A0A2L2L8K1_AGRTU|nr:hypothetical protein [Agrobacterium tumefaciens]AVH40642.1 hypothetical protein At1D1609_05900 [Agrobacterium tumefaciens]NSY94590.1 hypothetical protein [Agrobacterium tumefaciens]